MKCKRIVVSSFQCKCNGVKRPQTVVGFGCKTGGFPYCSNKFDFMCRNGDRVNRIDILKNRLSRANGGNPGCICSDNHRPVCASTGEGGVTALLSNHMN